MNKKTSASALKTKSINQKSILLAIAFVGLLILISASSYYFGSKNQPSPSPSPTPSPSPSSSPDPSDNNLISSPDPDPSPQPSPQPSPSPETHTETLKSQAGHDGFRASNAGGNSTIEIRAGRNPTLIVRGFLSFKIEDLPDNITIEEARLKVYQTDTAGNPYSAGIRVVVDHLDYGDSLEHADYSSPSISANFAILSTNDSVGWKEIDVTDQVRNDLDNSRIRSQYRLHFAVESTGGISGDWAYFESGDNSQGTGNLPELIIKYH